MSFVLLRRCTHTTCCPIAEVSAWQGVLVLHGVPHLNIRGRRIKKKGAGIGRLFLCGNYCEVTRSFSSGTFDA